MRTAAERGTLPAMQRVPSMDQLPDSPVDWVDIPLGEGQEPNAYGGPGSFQHTKDLSETTFEAVRRNPDETFQIISRVPERP